MRKRVNTPRNAYHILSYALREMEREMTKLDALRKRIPKDDHAFLALNKEQRKRYEDLYAETEKWRESFNR